LRAAQVTELGRPPEVGEVPDPVPSDGDVLLEVLAAPLNPLDVNLSKGLFYGGHPPLPYVPGCECVGRRRDTGELVWAFGSGVGLSRNGTMAELAAVPADSLVPVPDGADPALAGALGIAGLAGWMPVAVRAPVLPDDRVLVLGATGTVGLVAVQGCEAPRCSTRGCRGQGRGRPRAGACAGRRRDGAARRGG
jgi:NADPH2:quinone reductase